jgi:hypothetical protein
MKKINFTQQVLPHLIAVVLFLLVTVFFFSPVFFENKTIMQHDVVQSVAASKALVDYRTKTGEEGLWAPSMFSGMPAYLISVQWSNTGIHLLKRIISLNLPHPVNNIFIAFVSYYILLLAFRIRPYLAIAGALAFGLSSFMIIGFSAGHNARIGAMALIPLVIAGIHLAFSGKRLLGFALTAAALGLHLRENHLQVTYYLLLIVLGYGLMQFVVALQEKRLGELFKTVAILIPAALLAVGTFFGQLWGVAEYSAYSTRGKSELPASENTPNSGLNRDYVFNYSNGILEPMTLLVPNFYGGSSMQYLFYDQKSNTYQALANSGNQQMANNLARYTTPYWGEQPLAAPYYAGAIVVFLFVIGIMFAERQYKWWLISLSFFAIMLSWGKNFETLNYFLYDYLPGYNKFRSVTFALVITFFAMPLLGMLGLEKLLEKGINQETKKKLLIGFASTGGLCLILLVISGMFGFLKEAEATLPDWFTNALRDDRKSLLRGDAFRSLAFIAAIFIILYFDLQKRITPYLVYGLITFFILIDLVVVDRRYFDKESYMRKREAAFVMTAAEQQVNRDKSYFRVFNVQNDARPAYFFNSISGYHGAKLRRYEDLTENGIYTDLQQLFADAQEQQLDFSKYGIINMLNCKYVIYGESANEVLTNPGASGPAWFIRHLEEVSSPKEELEKVNEIDTRTTAVIDGSKFQIPEIQYDSAATITLLEHQPNYIKYEAETNTTNLAVFSEIYYPEGWRATIDGKETPIVRVNYVLRALSVPAGKHVVEFKFAPKPYVVGNNITMASSWLVFLLLCGSITWTVVKRNE